jgi:hypothetical protein
MLVTVRHEAARQVGCLMTASNNSLSAKFCRDRAKECLTWAQQAKSQSHRIMLEHIAETWYRIADSFLANDA